MPEPDLSQIWMGDYTSISLACTTRNATLRMTFEGVHLYLIFPYTQAVYNFARPRTHMIEAPTTAEESVFTSEIATFIRVR